MGQDEQDGAGGGARSHGVQPQKELVQAVHAAVADDGGVAENICGQLIQPPKDGDDVFAMGGCSTERECKMLVRRRITVMEYEFCK